MDYLFTEGHLRMELIPRCKVLPAACLLVLQSFLDLDQNKFSSNLQDQLVSYAQFRPKPSSQLTLISYTFQASKFT